MADPRSAARTEYVQSVKPEVTRPDPEPEESPELFREKDDKFYCNICTYSVVRPAFLVKHVKDEHGQTIVIDFTCKCDKKFTDKKTYQRHVKPCI
jgi:hypothetical protein